MNIYKNYRKIWEKFYNEEIPKGYHIHHIDGNRNNNNPLNLICVSPEEHYNIHYVQGDYGACAKLAPLLEFSPEEISDIQRQAQLKRVKEGKHNFLGGNIQKQRIENGTHNFIIDNPTYKRMEEKSHNFITDNPSKKRVKNGTHHFIGGKIQKQKVKEGKHNFVTNNPSKIILKCPHCNKSGSKGPMMQWHFDNCKFKS